MIGRRSSLPVGDVGRPKGFDDFDLKLGDIMRGERATLGKSLLDVQRELRIKATYIAAIENTDASAFEAPSFIAGYVRSYARYLGMDPDQTFQRFCTEANFTVAHGMSAEASSLRGPAPLPLRKARKEYRDPLADPNPKFLPRKQSVFSHVEPRAIGSVLVLVGLIAGLGYGGWSVLQQIQRVQLSPVDQSPGVTAELDPLAGVEPLVTADSAVLDPVRPSPEAFDRLYRPQALDVPVIESRDGPIAAIDPATTGILAHSAPVELAEAALPLPIPMQMPEVALPQVVAAAAPEVAIIAVRPAWVRVQASNGTIILEKILDAGERFPLPQSEEPATLRAGNSGAVYFAVNGETYGPAAPGAQVVKNVKLSPDALKTSFQVADLAKDPALAKVVAMAEATE
ncbi:MULTISPECIES: helix-turn-helix domain-containing protein [Haematobacter]|nr:MULTISPECIES: helix-turn-helix domain-containing protein [Haematobacter]